MLWPGKVQRTGENSCLMIAQRVSVPASVIQSSCSGSVSWKSDCRKDARQKNLQRLLSFDITSVWFPPRDQSIMAVLLVEYHLDDQLLVNGKWNGIELLSCYIMSATDSFIRLEIILNVWKRAWANVFARWKGTLTETKIKLRSSEEACTISRGTPKQVRTLQHALTASGNLIPKTSWYLKLKLGSNLHESTGSCAFQLTKRRTKRKTVPSTHRQSHGEGVFFGVSTFCLLRRSVSSVCCF